jgi:hypothetical protein
LSRTPSVSLTRRQSVLAAPAALGPGPGARAKLESESAAVAGIRVILSPTVTAARLA